MQKLGDVSGEAERIADQVHPGTASRDWQMRFREWSHKAKRQLM